MKRLLLPLLAALALPTTVIANDLGIAAFDFNDLPQRYKNSVVFQVTNVKHSISNSRWKTTVEAIMRRRPMDMGIYLIGSGEEPRQLGTIGLKNPRHMGNFEIEQTEGDAMPTNEGGDGIKYENLNPEDSSAEPI